MKFNPYPVLLTTGALMLATVIFTRVGPPDSPGRMLVADEPPGADVAHHPDTRVASVDGAIAAGNDDRALEE